METKKLTTTITRRIEWDAAHRVLRHESKCSTLHGHRYVALLTMTAAELDFANRVIDFSVVKDVIGGWVDRVWDHTTLVNRNDTELARFALAEHDAGKRAPYFFDGEPTAEAIASHLLDACERLLTPHGIQMVSVEVFETPNCSATVTA